MFESVVPETFAPRSRKVLYESLPMSIAAHAAIGAVILVAGVWNVSFPKHSPRVTLMYQLALEPTPPPAAPARPAAAAAPKPAPEEKQQATLPEIVAPTIIPDEVPIQEAEPLPPELDFGLEPAVGNAGGVIGGVGDGYSPDGVGGGEPGGKPGGMPGGIEGGVEGGLPPDTVIIKRHQPLPMSMTPMSMVYPFYPEEARVRGWEDAVTVRYVIGKDGRVKTVTVLESSKEKIFEKTVVKAIRHWRFRPLVKQGVAQEVIHELVVNFKLNQGMG